MQKKTLGKIVCGAIIVIVCLYYFLVLSLYSWQRKLRYITELPSIGSFEYKEWGSNALVTVKKLDDSVINIHYKNGKATDKRVLHPIGHSLSGKIQPAADEKTLYLATELLPTLIEISKGRKVKIGENILTLIEDYPSDLYRFNFKEEPNTYYLRLFDGLFLSGYDYRPNARMPFLAYWGPETRDTIGDDVIYCGDWLLNEFLYNQSLKISPDSLFSVKTGDIIHFREYTLHIRYIDNDGDLNRWNNAIILYIEGPKEKLNVAQRDSVGRKPITSIDFINTICQKDQEDLKEIPSFNGPISEKDFKKQLLRFADAETEEERAFATQEILFEYGYNENDIKMINNGYGNSKDLWIEKKGQLEDVVIIAAHYDKAGQESQGIHDNACGVVIVANLAGTLRSVNTRLSYIFLFYGAHEVDGHTWDFWLVLNSCVKSNIKYSIEVGGGGLIDAKQIFLLDQKRLRGWQHWRFPELRINEEGGPPDFQKHTRKDNIGLCDFSHLLNSFKTTLHIVSTIDQNL